MIKTVQICAALVALLSVLPAGAQTEATQPLTQSEATRDFARIDLNEDGAARALQMAIVSYERPDGAAEPPLKVDLISAIHIGDESYFAELNERFRDYDSVLYEIVAPEGTRVPQGGGESRGLVSAIQLAMTRALGLTFQLQQVDYSPENLVHADLSPDEMSSIMADRGESFGQYFMKLFFASMNETAAQNSQAQSAGLLFALLSEDRERLLKIQVALSMLDTDQMLAILEGESGSTLIGERNRRVMEVLERQIASGDRHIGIFYGGGHMPDFDKRLQSQFGLVRTDRIWVDAWDLR